MFSSMISLLYHRPGGSTAKGCLSVLPLLISFLGIVCCATTAAQSKDGSYYVHVKGDTVFNLTDAYIDLHAHPQRIHFTKPDNIKVSVSADSIVRLRIYYEYSFPKRTVLEDFVTRKVMTKKGQLCTHFLRSEYTFNQSAIGYSPYCNQCSSLTFYIITEANEATALSRKNFSHAMEKYFGGSAELDEFRSRHRYTPKRLSSFLTKLKRQPKSGTNTF
jgi:hypothetical protein